MCAQKCRRFGEIMHPFPTAALRGRGREHRSNSLKTANALMLRGLRKASSNWLGKVVMAAVVGFLVISFAIWGIGDIFRGFGRSTVAKIGRTEISVDQFRIQYNDRLQQFSRQLGRPLTTEQVRAMGIDRLIISQIISEIVLDDRVRALGLGLSDAEVAKQITS